MKNEEIKVLQIDEKKTKSHSKFFGVVKKERLQSSNPS